MSKNRNLILTNGEYEMKPIGYGYNVAVLRYDEDNCGGCVNGEHCGPDGTEDGCCCERVDLTDVIKVDGSNRKWRLVHDREADAETFRSAKQAVEAIDANLSAYLKPKATRAKAEPTGTKIHASHRGGRSLIPGWSMTDARTRAAETLAQEIMDAADRDSVGVDVYEVVEGTLMDATEDNSTERLAEGNVGAYLVSELGKVLNEYLRQNRQDRYGYILTKIHQATGRALVKAGRDRKTGLRVETKGGK